MKKLSLFIFILCFIQPVIAISEASPILVWEWWNAPLDVIIDARDRLNRAIVDKGGEAVKTAPVIQDNQNEQKTNIDNQLKNALQTITPKGVTDALPEKPSVFSYAYDYSFGTLSKDQFDEITKEGKRLSRKTGVQALILVVKTFGNSTGNEFVTNIINQWGIGSKERNDGLLIAYAVEERIIQIGTGSGIDTILNNRICGEILDANLQYFTKGDYGEGFLAVYKDVSDFFISRIEENDTIKGIY